MSLDVPLSPNLGAAERNYVYSVAMKYLKDESEAEDVTQDALLLAHRYRESFRGDSRYSTWLYRIAATTALMHLRRRKRRAREIACSQLGAADQRWLSACPAASRAAPERLASLEGLVAVAKTVDTLGEKYKRLFWLRFADGYSESEVAQLLDLPLSTVKTRAFRARHEVALHCGRAA